MIVLEINHESLLLYTLCDAASTENAPVQNILFMWHISWYINTIYKMTLEKGNQGIKNM